MLAKALSQVAGALFEQLLGGFRRYLADRRVHKAAMQLGAEAQANRTRKETLDAVSRANEAARAVRLDPRARDRMRAALRARHRGGDSS